MFSWPSAGVRRACLVAGVVLATLTLSSAIALAEAPVTLLHDGFDQPTAGGVNDLITNQFAYWNAGDPTAVVSPIWEMTSGSLFSVGGLGWTGAPDDKVPDAGSQSGNDSQIFRLDTVGSDFGDVNQSVDVRVNGFVSSVDNPAEDYDGIVLWPRYVDETHLYFAYLLRRDGKVEVTKKCPGMVPGGDYHNGGSYFVLADEKSFGGPPEPGRWYHLTSTVQDNADGSVSLLVFRDGDLVDEVVDRGVGCDPIHGPTKLGIRADNTDANFDDYTVSSLSPPGADTGAATVITPTSADIAGTVDPQQSRAWYRLEYGTGTNYAEGGTVDPIEVPAGAPVQVDRQLTDLSPGTVYHYRLVAMSASGERFGPDQTFHTPPAAGSLPVVDAVSIDPGDPRTNDLLTATASAHDPAGVQLRLEYQWLRNGTPVPGATGRTLDLSDSGAGQKGDRITVQVTPVQEAPPSLTGQTVTSDAVTIRNTPPVVDSVTITPSSARTADTLTADVVKHDADGDPVTFAYQWLRNGTEMQGATTKTLDLSAPDAGDRGDAISVRVTATEVLDPADPATPATSAPTTSDSLTVGDTPPTLDGVTIDQSAPATDAVLAATATGLHDADGDGTDVAYQWLRNGTEIPGATSRTLDLATSGAGDRGDRITVRATPVETFADGISGDAVTSAAATVADTPPVVDSVVIDQSSAAPDGLLSATASAHDLDADPLRLAYQWLRNGQALPGETGSSLQLSPSMASPGDLITVSVTAIEDVADGVASATVTSGAVSITAAPSDGGQGCERQRLTGWWWAWCPRWWPWWTCGDGWSWHMSYFGTSGIGFRTLQRRPGVRRGHTQSLALRRSAPRARRLPRAASS